MLKRYQIWDKVSPIITPNGAFFTPEQWMEKYPSAAYIAYVIAQGEVNGAFCTALSMMKQSALHAGCDFSGCQTDEEVLQAIEDWEDTRNTAPTEPTNEDISTAALASIAAQMEYQNMMTLADVEGV